MMKNKKIITVITTIAIICMVAGTSIQARATGEFDPIFYAALYPDVYAAFGVDTQLLYNHYITFGQKEGRIPYAGAIGGETVDGIKDVATNTANPANANNVAVNPVCVANGHSWITTAETINHPSLGHMERTEKKVGKIRCGCGAVFTSDEDYQNHCISEGHGRKPYTVWWETAYEDNWVVTQEEWDETVTKNVCAVCGLAQ